MIKLRIGLIARSDHRGISYQTHEFWKALKPARTLVVQMNDRLFPEDREMFAGPGAIRVDSDMVTRSLPEKKVREFISAVDVIFAVETVYDWELCNWAREAGVATVVQGNPEFYVHHRNHDAHPDHWVWPTPWLLDELPSNTILPVPCPVAPDRLPAPSDDGPIRIVHPAGHQAHGDRDGTELFIRALPKLNGPAEVTIVTQDESLPHIPNMPSGVTLKVVTGGVADRWDIYRHQHLTVLPRRYAGLSLKVLESLAGGVPVLMPNCSPNEIWPGPRIPTTKGRMLRVKHGPINTTAVYPGGIASEINKLNKNRDRLADLMVQAYAWGLRNNWEALAPEYLHFLEEVAS